jgi:hypothetical protein
MRGHTRAGAALLALAAAVLVSAGCGGNRTTGGPSGTDNGGTSATDRGGTSGAPAVAVKADELAKAYADDAKAAEAKYKDKSLAVEGIVSNANQVVTPGKIVLNGYKKSPKDVVGMDVYCTVKPDQLDKAVLLSKGQKVKVTGRSPAANSLGVYLQDCDVTALGPSTTLEVTAEQLTGEYAKDKDAADKKYREKEVIVSGKVADLTKERGFQFAKLAGVSPWVVSCTISADDFGQLHKGDQVRIKGDCSVAHDNQVGVNTAFVLKAK